MRLKTKENALLERFKKLCEMYPDMTWEDHAYGNIIYHLIHKLGPRDEILKEVQGWLMYGDEIEFVICNDHIHHVRWEGYDYRDCPDAFDGYEYFLQAVENAVDDFEIAREVECKPKE